MEKKIGFISKTTMNPLFQPKLLLGRKRLESGEMEEGSRLLRGNERNIADNMHLAVCWNVGFVEQIYQGEDGIAVLNIKRRFGNALNLQRTEKDFVRIAREYRNK